MHCAMGPPDTRSGLTARNHAEWLPTAVQACPQLDVALQPLFNASAPAKSIIGLELTGDLRKLASSYPHIAAFQRVSSMLDLKAVYSEHQAMVAGQERQRRSRQVGLSFLSSELLGKPLDKSMQVRAKL